MVGGDMLIVEHTLELQSAQGVGDIVEGADGGEYLVEHAAGLDITLLLGGLLIVGLEEGLAAVALTEGDLRLMIAEIDL